MSDLAILVPVLRRPHRVAPLLESIRATVPSAKTLFICSPADDEEIREIEEAIRRYGEAALDYTICDGNYAAKINHGRFMASGVDLYFLGADDLCFHPGWFEAALGALRGAVGVVGTNDLGSPRVMAGEHSTHSLVTRDYAKRGTIDEPDKLLHEGYPHEFVDDEFVQTAKHRGAFAFAADSRVEHLHPNWGKAETDPLYAAQRLRMKAGRKVFRSREYLWA